ncbi:MAG: hypothetical protein HY711_11505, partial [Candidatus Melainabacteria bacterium]|nr:hypothetical protein [Candidatus Melainabacteria bacterium]
MSKQEHTPAHSSDSQVEQSHLHHSVEHAGTTAKFQADANLSTPGNHAGDRPPVTYSPPPVAFTYIDVSPIFAQAPQSSLPIETIRHAALTNASQHSVSDLINLGVLKESKPGSTPERGLTRSSLALPADKVQVRDQAQESSERTVPVQKLRVVYADQSNDPSARTSQADFRVGKDGSLEVVNNPEKNNKTEIVIEVEREQGQTERPTEAQQKSIDDLTGYLTQRFMQKQSDGTTNGTIEDKQGLVSESLKAQLKAKPTPEYQLPEATRHQIENMDRFSGGGRGRLSAEQADTYFPSRDVPRLPGETNQQAALKDVVAGMLQADATHPYEATRQIEGRGTAVGRYLLTYDLFMQWLTDLLGDPPDPAKLEEAVKKGKISASMAAKLKSPQFKDFLEKMKKGEKLSATEIKEFMPKEFQETVAGDLITKFANQTKDGQGNVDAGKVALSLALGHVPSQEELGKPEYKAFSDAAKRLYSIASARATNPGQSLDWQEIPGSNGQPSTLAVKLAQSAERTAARTDTVGWCYAGVKDALRPFGINLEGGSAYMARDQLARDSR